MGEYLRDELAKTCKVKRPLHLGFGQNSLSYSGNVANGVKQSQIVQYSGPGIFNVMGIMPIGWAPANWVVALPGRATFAWSILNSNRRAIIEMALTGDTTYNNVYDNLDEGFVLAPTDYLIYETTSYVASARQFGGILYGDEYLF